MLTPDASDEASQLCSCTTPRLEEHQAVAPRDGLALVRRCVECGAQSRLWLHEPNPVAPPPAERRAARAQADWDRIESRRHELWSQTS